VLKRRRRVRLCQGTEMLFLVLRSRVVVGTMVDVVIWKHAVMLVQLGWM
jgi:hypothetical protein